MDKFFWLELIIPMALTAILYWSVQYTLFKFDKRGYLWGVLFSAGAFILLVFSHLYISRFFIDIQCTADYGDLAASDPKMCDNPANGILGLLQVPFLLIAWITISIFAFVKLKPVKQKSSVVLSSTSVQARFGKAQADSPATTLVATQNSPPPEGPSLPRQVFLFQQIRTMPMDRSV